MSKDPVPEWFGKDEAEPPKHRGSAEARSSIGCAMPVAFAVLLAAGGAGVFVLTKRPAPRSVTTAITVTPPTPELLQPPTPTPVPVAPPPAVETTEPTDVAPEPSAAAGDAATEPLSAAQIKSVMLAARKRFTACYENALNYAPDATGTVRLSLAIASTGRVQVASATQTGNLPPQVAACITAIARTLKFEESSEQTTVTYPLVFASQ
jgi:hypothetical protein